MGSGVQKKEGFHIMNRLKIKETAVLGARHFDPEMSVIFVAVLEKSPRMDGNVVVVTSGSDSHIVGLHPNFRALDFRCKNVKAENLVERRKVCEKWAGRVAQRLGTEYDVVFEKFENNSDADHLHVEYDKG